MQSDIKVYLCPFCGSEFYAPFLYISGGECIMNQFSDRPLALIFRKAGIWILALFWIFGLVLHPASGITADLSFFLMLRRSSVSIVSLLSVLMLPFLLSSFAFSVKAPWLVCLIAMFKGFCLGYNQQLMINCFGSASWLIYFLYLFSDVLTMPVLWYFWSSCLKGSGFSMKNLLKSLVWVFVFTLVDTYFIGPYLSVL